MAKHVHLQGEYDVLSAAGLERKLREALLSSGDGSIVIDLRYVTFIDSTGLDAVKNVAATAAAAEGSVAIVHANTRQRRIIHLTGLDQIIDLRAE